MKNLKGCSGVSRKRVVMCAVVLLVGTVGAITYNVDGLLDVPGSGIFTVDSFDSNIPVPAGDFNGDGYPDVISGNSFVRLGTGGESTSGLIRFTGLQNIYYATGVGDINSDGYDDVGLVARRPGDKMPSPSSTAPSGGYVIFGSPSHGSQIDMRSIASNTDSRGFHVSGPRGYFTQPFVGLRPLNAVSATGDMNGDGLREVVFSDARFDNETGFNVGKVWVVFGKDDGMGLEETAFDSPASIAGFTVTGDAQNVSLGESLTGLSDFNGDGIDDIALSTINRAFVVYGKADNTPVYISDIAAGDNEFGFQIVKDIDPGLAFGKWVASAGDVNADGYGDLAIGSMAQDYSCGDSGPVPTPTPIPGPYRKGGVCDDFPEGYTMILLGGPENSNMLLSDAEAAGRMIRINAGPGGPFTVDGLGDYDGNGFADFVSTQIHIPGTVNETEFNISFSVADLMGQVDEEFRLPESLTDTYTRTPTRNWGLHVAGMEDWNGDGMNDLAVGFRPTLILNPYSPPSSSAYRAYVRGGEAPLTPIGSKGNGTIKTPDSRAWVGFDDGDTSLVNVEIYRRLHGSTVISGLEPAVAWKVSTQRTGWSSASLKMRYLGEEQEALVADDSGFFSAASASGPWTFIDETEYDPVQRTISFQTDTLGYFALAAHNLPPELSISAPDVDVTTSGPVSWEIDYRYADAVDLQEDDVVLNVTGSATGIVTVTDGDTFSPIVTISEIAGTGSLGISILPGTAMDMDGTTDNGAGPSQTVDICGITVAPRFITFNDEFTPFEALITVDAVNPVCPWTASSMTPWIAVTDGAMGTGDGNITIRVDPNTGSTRFGSVDVGQFVVQVQQLAATPGVDTLGLEAPAGFSDVSDPIIVKSGKSTAGMVKLEDAKNGYTIEMNVSGLTVDSNGLVSGIIDGVLRNSSGSVVETKSIPVIGRAVYSAKETIHMMATDYFGGYIPTGTVNAKSKLSMKGRSGDKLWSISLKGKDQSSHPPYSPPQSEIPAASFDAKVSVGVKKMAKAKGEVMLTNWRTENAEVGFDRSTTAALDSFGRKWSGTSVLYSPFEGAPVSGGSASMKVKFADSSKGKLGKASISNQVGNMKVKAKSFVVGTQPGSVATLRPEEIPMRMTNLSMSSPGAKTKRKITWDQSLLLLEK